MSRKERNYSPPFLVVISSGGSNEHCDIFPHGSIHIVKECEEGYMWLADEGRVHSIPKNFNVQRLENRVPYQKQCSTCNNWFHLGWPFAKNDQCIRCFERINVSIKGMTRDEYRELLRKELSLG